MFIPKLNSPSHSLQSNTYLLHTWTYSPYLCSFIFTLDSSPPPTHAVVLALQWAESVFVLETQHGL